MKQLRFHPIGDLFTNPTLSSDFLSKAKYKQVADEVTRIFEEITLGVDVKHQGPFDARARAFAVTIGNDRFCRDNDVPESIVELSAELVQQTLKRLAFHRSISGAVYEDHVYAFKAPKSYGDIQQSLAHDYTQQLMAFSNIKAMLATRSMSAKNINEDIIESCNQATSASLFMLQKISGAKFSATRSNQIYKTIQEAKKNL